MDSTAGLTDATLAVIANGDTVRLPGDATLADLVAHLDLGARRIAVEHNGCVVPRARHPQTHLADGDRIEIVQAVGGG
jgi:sulfur carrier protein